MKKTFLLSFLFTFVMVSQVNAIPPRGLDKPLDRVQAHWYKHSNWKHLEEQYLRNQDAWDMVLFWMTTNPVAYMPAGKYYVGPDSIRITIQDACTRAESKIEAHVQYVDVQWTISGTEIYHVLKPEDVEPINKYNSKKDVQHFTEKEGRKPKVLKSDPSTLFVFFPDDPHRALLMDSQPDSIRKVVAKIPYIRH